MTSRFPTAVASISAEASGSILIVLGSERNALSLIHLENWILTADLDDLGDASSQEPMSPAMFR
jgi:hypothetical protein